MLSTLNITSVFRKLFEKNGCLVKNFYILIDSKRKSLILYTSALILKTQSIKSRTNDQNLIAKATVGFQKKIFDCLRLYGLTYNTRFVFHNLNKAFVRVKINSSPLQRFKRELYYYPSLDLLKILCASSNNSVLVAKFIAKFFKLFHRSKKGNKFFFIFSYF